MSKTFKDVHTFMVACGQSVYVDNQAQTELYHRLINEEYGELLDAIRENDEVEQIDACFDLMWVVIGYMKSRGWDCNGIWDEGALSNLAKIDKATGKVIKRADGKVLKPEGWQEPDFTTFAKNVK